MSTSPTAVTTVVVRMGAPDEPERAGNDQSAGLGIDVQSP
jgi:hypothetical protein